MTQKPEKTFVKYKEKLDLRLLFPSLVVFAYTLCLILLIDYIVFFMIFAFLALFLAIVYLFCHTSRYKKGYGLHSKLKNGNFVYFLVLVTFLCVLVTGISFQYKNNYENVKNELFDNRSLNVSVLKKQNFSKTINSFFIAEVKQYVTKVPKNYVTKVKVLYKGERKNTMKKILPFEATIFLKEKTIKSKNVFETNSHGIAKKWGNVNEYKEFNSIENFFIPGSLILFKAKPVLNNFHENWVSFYISNDDERQSIVKIKNTNFAWKIANNIRGKILKTLDLGKKYDSLIMGMSVGNTNYISEEVIQMMKDTSTIHLMSVSGTHLCMITLFLNTLFFWCRPKIKLFIVACFYLIFILLVGPLIPILRSITMGMIASFGVLLKNHVKSVPIFAITFLSFILYCPLYVTNYSFLLSSFSTLAIIVFVNNVSNYFRENFGFNKTFLNMIFVSFFAQLFTIPILLVFYSKISLVGVLANFFITPLASLLTILGILIGFTPDFLLGEYNFLYVLASSLSFVIGEIIRVLQTVPFGVIEWGTGWKEIFNYICVILLPIFLFVFCKKYKSVVFGSK